MISVQVYPAGGCGWLRLRLWLAGGCAAAAVVVLAAPERRYQLLPVPPALLYAVKYSHALPP